MGAWRGKAGLGGGGHHRLPGLPIGCKLRSCSIAEAINILSGHQEEHDVEGMAAALSYSMPKYFTPRLHRPTMFRDVD